MSSIIEKTTDISNSDNSEIYKCKVCETEKNISQFHTYSLLINNNIIKKTCLNEICMDCLPYEAIYWPDGEIKPKLNKELIIKKFRENQKQKIQKELNIDLSQLISRVECFKMLGLGKDDKKWINAKVKDGIFSEIKIPMYPKFMQFSKILNQEKYQKYYKLQEIQIFKYIRDNGHFIIRGQKSIKQGVVGTNNPPYHFITPSGRQYMFVNMTDRKKPCVRCCEIKDFELFHKGITESGLRNICTSCEQDISRNYYSNLDEERKKDMKIQAEEWIKNNKDKVKLYRKIYSGKIEVRLRRNLRSRVTRLVGLFQLEHVRQWYKKYNIKDNNVNWLGCDYGQFINYIESKFQPGMTWENYGVGYKIDETGETIKINQWNIDHIKPVSSFNLNDLEEIKKINHYTNLLPMWCDDNVWKSAKTELCPILDKEFLDKYKELEILTNK